MKKKDRLSAFEVLDKTIDRIYFKFSDMSDQLVSKNSIGFTKISYRDAIIRIKANKFLMCESVMAWSKALSISESDLKSKLESMPGNLKYIPELTRLEIIDENEEMGKVKDCVSKCLSVFPDIKYKIDRYKYKNK